MNRKEKAFTLGCLVMSVTAAESHYAERMDMPTIVTPICKTCLRPFKPSRYNPDKQYCDAYCAKKKTQARPYVEHTCLTCQRTFRVRRKVESRSRLSYCWYKCIPSRNADNAAIPIPKRKDPSLSLYIRDEELFAQRMCYTLNGMTWWGTPCVYCGDPAEDDEHVLPLSAFKKLSAAGNIRIPRDILRIVPACHECNLLLNDKVFESFEEKKLYAKAALAKRYYRVLQTPHWSDEEVAELHGRMQDWIAHGQDIRALVFERLRF